jgi:Domain of unknown function (DUF4293)
MIQRIQSIWLLLAAAFAAITFRFPFYIGQRIANPLTMETVHDELNATSTVWITLLTILSGAIAFADIFLFSNRKLQLRLAYLGIFTTVALLVVYFLDTRNFVSNSSTFALSSIFQFAILAFYILAARGIWKDEKLIKSMDRLR